VLDLSETYEFARPLVNSGRLSVPCVYEIPERADIAGLSVEGISVANGDIGAELRSRYLGDAGAAVYLMRPDQHVAARWTTLDWAKIETALNRAIGKGEAA
jgi:3-(3-hydroxy-phenyl)propionate hydroxylase